MAANRDCALFMKLYIAEKPSLARAIAAAMPGQSSRDDGFIRCANGDVISWCVGHLLEQAEPEAYDPRYKQWRLEHLPIIPEQWQLVPRPKMKTQLGVLRRLSKQATELVHAGDPDREGQLLVDEVIDYLGVGVEKRQTMKRLLIADLNPSAVRQSLARLRENREFLPLSVSALARSRADWLFGINLTRALTLQGRRVGFDGLLSVGRVQTPVLGLVVARDREIEAFTPKPYYEVAAHLETPQGERFTALWQPSEACANWQDEEGRVLSEALAKNVAQRISGRTGLVESAQRKEGSQPPPLPYNLSSLQMDASKRFGLSAQQVLDACQALYEKHRVITYPRSDCRYLPAEHHSEATQVVSAIRRCADELKPACDGADLRLRSSAWNDSKVGAHHAIIPTRKASASGLSKSEAQVYELIARQYLMQFYPRWAFADVKLEIRIEGGLFMAKARQTLEPGWKVLLGKKEEDARLPRVQVNDALLCREGEVLSKMTQPPKAFTDASLLAAMTGIARFVTDTALRKVLRETDGLGTEATRAGIIELLIRRGYLRRQGKVLSSSEAGRGLIDALPAQVTLPDMTAHWESALDAMARREGRYDAFMGQLSERLTALVEQVAAKPPEALRGVKVEPGRRGRRSAAKGGGKRRTSRKRKSERATT